MEKVFTKELPADFETLRLYPLSDVHLGEALTDLDLFHKFMKHINEAPNRYVVIVGDLINNNLKNSVGSVYEDIIPPGEQKKIMKKKLREIKDRIIVMVSGNHESRTKKETDQDITEDIADYLGVPYQEEDALIKLTFGKKYNQKRQCYSIYLTHGWAGGKRPGSVLNNLESLSMNIMSDIYIVGHSHRKIAHKAVFRLPDLKNNVIREVEQLFVSSSHWQSYGGYAKKKAYRPQAKGSVPITLHGKEKVAIAEV